MQKVADQIQHDLSVPFLHIADATIAEILRQGLTKIALLGTIFTMEQEFYHSRFKQQGIELIVPDESLIVRSLIRLFMVSYVEVWC